MSPQVIPAAEWPSDGFELDTRCNCESAYCVAHGGSEGLATPPPWPTCEPCPNAPSGRFRMMFVGAICDACAATNCASGGADLIYERGPELEAEREAHEAGEAATAAGERRYAAELLGDEYRERGV